ncbi:MAG: LicD family protein [Eubacterium sp.]|nr:LicD family protein [Eubacterium sp.]
MIASKTMYSRYFGEYKLSTEELEHLHKILLKMLLDIDEVCKKNNIEYMLSGGTALGAVRHEGFIPWDDDIDLMMTRENYMKLVKCFDRGLNGKYILAEPLYPDYFFKQPKIYLKDSVYVEIPWEGIKKYEMIFIDIFIIEYVPDSKWKQKIISKIYDFSYKASSLCIDYLYPSQPILEKSKVEKEVNNYYKFRRGLGHIFSVIGGIHLYLIITENISKKYSKTNSMGIPSGISYCREILPAEVYLKTTTVSFEGYEFKIPQNYQKYLENLYGKNYMEIPPQNKREIHVAYRRNL